jgi:hypothetical protein
MRYKNLHRPPSWERCSNNWSDDGSSNNECNREFNLNHFGYRNIRGSYFLAINAEGYVVVMYGGFENQPEESGDMGRRFLYPSAVNLICKKLVLHNS